MNILLAEMPITDGRKQGRGFRYVRFQRWS
jgi:hypothetical protein